MSTNSKLSTDSHYKGISFAVLMTILSASAMALIKVLSADLAVELITFWQYAVCLLCICLSLLKQNRCSLQNIRHSLLVHKADRWMMFFRCLAGLVGFYALYLCVARIPLVEATLLRNASPLFVPLFAWWLLNTRTDAVRWLIIGCGFGGISLILFPQGYKSQQQFDWGYLAGLVSAIMLAISMIYTNILGNRYRTENILFYYYLLSTLGMLPLAIQHWQWLNLQQSLYLVYIGFAIHGALFLYTRAFSLLSPAVVAPLTYLSIVHAGVIGFVVWGDIPPYTAIIGMIIVVISGIATTLYKQKNT